MSSRSSDVGTAFVTPELHRQIMNVFEDIFQIRIDLESGDLARTDIETWDSVNHLRLVTEIEEIYEIALSDEEVTTISSMRDLELLILARRPAVCKA